MNKQCILTYKVISPDQSIFLRTLRRMAVLDDRRAVLQRLWATRARQPAHLELQQNSTSQRRLLGQLSAWYCSEQRSITFQHELRSWMGDGGGTADADGATFRGPQHPIWRITTFHLSLTLTASAQLVRKTNIIIPLVVVTLASRKNLQNYGAESAAVLSTTSEPLQLKEQSVLMSLCKIFIIYIGISRSRSCEGAHLAYITTPLWILKTPSTSGIAFSLF